MEKKKQVTALIPCIALFLLLSTIASASAHEDQQTFIVHVSKPHKPVHLNTHQHWYTSTLSSLPPSEHPTKLLYTYDHTLHGFAARLTPTQAATLRKIPGIKSVVPERIRHIRTTRSPDFLGLNKVSGLWPNSDYADDVVIGVLDTGIWPERRSFSDAGLSPVPSTWKGICQTGSDFPASSCNKKLIGARYFSAGYEAQYGPIDEKLESKSPRDTEGHGTHTASTAAGSSVLDAGFYEFAKGEARGMATKARISVYKICWKEGCFDADILAAIDQAVDDGVHVISISVSLEGELDYDDDSFAIGTFGAVQKGVFVSSAGGNSGPGKSTVENIAPWLLTVGASTIDRSFPADAILGDGTVYSGISLYSGTPLDPTAKIPLVYAGADGVGHRLCVPDTFKGDVKGKIVVCDRGANSNVEKGSAVKLAGGVGMILASTASTGPSNSADVHILPTSMVDPIAGDKIKNYAQSDKNPTATIVPRGTVIGPSPPAPQVASFSGRGPNEVTPQIIKPDVIAPGVNILASWTGAVSPSELEMDSRRVEFNFQSGTSMACPHVSGLAALLRKAHPKWSPAAIKSAIMTTAFNLDKTGENIKDFSTGKESTPFEHGSGHVDPNRAVDPGLVYDLGVDDYISFLCSIEYDEDRIAVIVKDRTVDCSTMGFSNGPGDLNYPSFSVVFTSDNDVVKYRRVVKNVGKSADAVYEVKVTKSASVDVEVIPSKLVFSAQNQSLSYDIKFTSVADQTDGEPKFGAIEWTDGAHVVRSPIAYTWGSSYLSSM
ncbi:Peptidase S8/S53 domain [Macleaya cordata]|uniref:Peptidase S8/S53 domain n=1 Tax=Macleaya cordata TaxID=56857 RepID=A0A200Q018_MACCD|nr:Peptidase S8/S53 domain [Macleaya cordata]